MGKVKYQKCPLCREEHGVLLSSDQLERYENRYLLGREHIQDVLPELGIVEREFLITGYCHKCQELIFGNTNRPNLTLWV